MPKSPLCVPPPGALPRRGLRPEHGCGGAWPGPGERRAGSWGSRRRGGGTRVDPGSRPLGCTVGSGRCFSRSKHRASPPAPPPAPADVRERGGKHSGPAGGPAGLRGRGRRGGRSPPPSPALRRWFPSAAPARPALTLLAAAAAGGGLPAAARPPSPRLRIEVAVVGDVRAGGSASSWGRRRLPPAPPPPFQSQS